MNILTLELEYSYIFYILPSFGITLGKSLYINIHWLNFELTLKHISTDYKAKYISFYSPSIILNQYPDSAYKYTLEVSIFHYFYRKGLFRNKDKEIQPWDNTRKFVHLNWLTQFKSDNIDSINIFEDLLKAIEEIFEKEKNNTDN